MPSTHKNNLFSLLLDGVDDDVTDLAVADAAPSSSNTGAAAVGESSSSKAPVLQKKVPAPEWQKKKEQYKDKERQREKPYGVYDQSAPRARPVDRSRHGGSQSQSVVTNGGSNGHSGNGYQGNRRTDGNSNQRSSNGSSGYQHKFGGDSVGNSAGNSMQRRGGYGGGRGRSNREDGRYNDYSNGAGNNKQFGDQQSRSYSHDRRVNNRNNQNNPSSERAVLNTARSEGSNNSETKDVPVPDNEGWVEVTSRKHRSRTYARSEASNNSEKRDDLTDDRRGNDGVNGRYPDSRRGRGKYFGNYREQNRDSEVIARSEASNNSEAKDDQGAVEHASNVDVNNADTKGDAAGFNTEEQTKSPPKEVKPAEEDGESQTVLSEKERRDMMWEEERRKKTLQQYEKECREKKKNLPPKEERIVALDKELESMQPVGKRMELLLPLVRREGSELLQDAGEKNDAVSVTDMPTHKSDKEKQHRKKEDVCKSIVQGLLRPTGYQRRRGPYSGSDESYPRKGNAAQGYTGKGNEAESTRRGPYRGSDESNPSKGNAAQGSTGKGNEAESTIKVKTEEIKAVQIEKVEVSLKFDDPLQFPVL